MCPEWDWFRWQTKRVSYVFSAAVNLLAHRNTAQSMVFTDLVQNLEVSIMRNLRLQERHAIQWVINATILFFLVQTIL